MKSRAPRRVRLAECALWTPIAPGARLYDSLISLPSSQGLRQSGANSAAKGISQGHYKDRGPVEHRPNQTQDSLLNGAYSARTPGVASVRSRNLSQLEFIFLAIAFSSARFSRATSAVCSSPAFLARRSKSS